MKTFTFTLQGQKLEVPENLLTADRFDIASVPRPYAYTWTSEKPGAFLQKLIDENPTSLLLIDQNVKRLHAPELKIPSERLIAVEATEDYKSLNNGVLPLVDIFSKRKITKTDMVFVVGGGIVQDIGAFACSIYKRGTAWTLVPSTLLSMCDSCIGGKTAINHQSAKNQLALFYAPRAVIGCAHFLGTLAPRERCAGLGEILKLCVTGGDAFLERYKAAKPLDAAKGGDPSALVPLIRSSLAVKKAVIEADEFELDLRRSMNYGHTVGHAIESLSNYVIPHGQAVSVGMQIVNELAGRRGWMPKPLVTELNSLCGDIIDADSRQALKGMDTKALTDLVTKDKKTTGAYANFAVVRKPGEMTFEKIENNAALSDEITSILRSYYA